jgi:hypothetical protein
MPQLVMIVFQNIKNTLPQRCLFLTWWAKGLRAIFKTDPSASFYKK